MIGQAGRWALTPPTTSLQPKNEMLIFGLHPTSDDWLARLIDSNPICHPSPAKIMKCSFLDFVQLIMISQAGRWTGTPFATPLQERNEKLILLLHSTSDDQPGRSMDSSSIQHSSSAKKLKCLFMDYIQHLMMGCTDQWTQIPSATPLQPK